MPLISESTAQGERSEQQDRYVLAEFDQGQFMAVMDGHGGSAAADRVVKALPKAFETALRAPGQIELALRDTIALMHQLTEREKSGTTLSCVFIPKLKTSAHVAVIGDSPVLIRSAKGLIISPLHNARSNAAEREAAIRRGARYFEPYLEDPRIPGQGLQMSRALGDTLLSRILDRRPDIYSAVLDQDSFVLVASDGVLDGSDPDFGKQLRKIADQIGEGYDARQVVADALKRRTGDNVTAILWRAETAMKLGRT